MKKIKLLLPLVMVSLGGFAQNNNYPTTGNPTVYDYSPTIFLQRNTSEGGYTQGIQTRLLDGTNNWFFGNLHDGQWMVAKGDYNNAKLTVLSNGNVGIGKSDPLTKLDVNGTAIISNSAGTSYNENLRLPSATSGFASIALGAIAGDWGTGFGQWSLIKFPESMASKFGIRHNNDDYLNILTNGNVGIGTTTPNEKLSVNGKIRAKEIKVETANWPDYVFAEGYKVGTLEELEDYIKVNKHLPDMPSAKEAETNGVELGEMNKLLLKKVEELTLYLIEKDKQIKQLENRMANLEKQKQ